MTPDYAPSNFDHVAPALAQWGTVQGLTSSLVSFVDMMLRWDLEEEIAELSAHAFVRLEREIKKDVNPWPARIRRYVRKCVTYWGPMRGRRGLRRRQQAIGHLLRAMQAFDAERTKALIDKVGVEQPKRLVELKAKLERMNSRMSAVEDSIASLTEKTETST